MHLHRADERYAHDPAFHALVQQLEGIIEGLHLSPSEIREAATYACYRVEVRRTTVFIRPPAPAKCSGWYDDGVMPRRCLHTVADRCPEALAE